MNCKKLDVNLIADMISWKFISQDSDISVLKLQKLLYYTEAWYLAINNMESLFEDDFEAWAHGPVCKRIFIRFKHQHGRTMYDSILETDIAKDKLTLVPEEVELHIDNVLEVYGKYTGVQLEDITHKEDPWKIARGNLNSYESSSEVIPKKIIGDYYKARIA